ncbi:MAG: MBL fold metallo-hydrolase [Planctomycetaceae bacterium]|nr:MBL fold metallo-hydrolase [Planctomycetaceae bacterium]
MTKHGAGDRGSRIMAGLGVMTLVACAAVIWNVTPEKRIVEDPVLKRRPVTLFDGVHLLGGLAPSVAYVVETSEGLVLVDSGLEANCQSLLQQMKYLQLNPGRLKKILLTHAHGDHVLGAMYLQRLTGARIYAGRADSDILRSGGPPEALFSTYDMPGIETHSTEVDMELEGGETIHSGDVRIEVIGTPGHTPGSLCFLMERDGRRILFSGDTVQSISGDLGTYAAYLSPRYRSSAADYLATLRKLRELPAPDVLLPGHPQVPRPPSSSHLSMPGSEADSPGVSAEVTVEQWQQMMTDGITEMQRLVDRYAADGADFLDGTPREILPGLYYLGEFSDWAVYVLREGKRWYVFDAPGGAGLIEFLEQRLQKLEQSLDGVAGVLVTSVSIEATAGLGGMVEKFKCPVVVHRDGLQSLRERLPRETRFVMAATIDEKSEFPVVVTSLSGRGSAKVVFGMRRADRSILVSGRLLGKVDNRRLVQELLGDLAAEDGDTAAYRKTLDLFESMAPDVWLPARPVNGQNANLYDQQWQSIIERNRTSLRKNAGPG